MPLTTRGSCMRAVTRGSWRSLCCCCLMRDFRSTAIPSAGDSVALQRFDLVVREAALREDGGAVHALLGRDTLRRGRDGRARHEHLAAGVRGALGEDAARDVLLVLHDLLRAEDGLEAAVVLRAE